VPSDKITGGFILYDHGSRADYTMDNEFRVQDSEGSSSLGVADSKDKRYHIKSE
jgi:hypothetical protein